MPLCSLLHYNSFSILLLAHTQFTVVLGVNVSALRHGLDKMVCVVGEELADRLHPGGGGK